MAFILTLMFVLAVAALAPRFGTDSRDLGRRRPDSFLLSDQDLTPQTR